MDHLLKTRGSIVDDLVGSQFSKEIVIARGSGHDDMRASPASKLDGKDPNAPCCTVDQDSLSRRKACQAVRAVSGTAAACTWSRERGLGASSLGKAMVYSASAPSRSKAVRA